MRRLGCTHAMLCWYFGNYPGLMNRAAGLLACESFEDGEEAFLRRLALPEWGDAADTVVRAWQRLADGYAQYPLEKLIGYYGPMHDGVVWLPTNSVGSAVRATLGVDAGAVVTITRGEA